MEKNKTKQNAINLNVDSYEEMCSIRIFDTSLADFSTNVDLHNSVKFHLPYGKFVYSELK